MGQNQNPGAALFAPPKALSVLKEWFVSSAFVLTIPDPSLVLLIGVSGAGKSTFCRRHFRPTEILSSDFYRSLVSDDENNQMATKDAFEVLHLVARKRLSRGLMTVIDATNVRADARRPLLEMAREYHVQTEAVILDLPEETCIDRNQKRANRDVGSQVVRQHGEYLQRSLPNLREEGFRYIYHLVYEQVEDVVLRRVPLRCNRVHDHGPFDIIGDVHGCCDELEQLLRRLGYHPVHGAVARPGPPLRYAHPEGRKVVFLGDLVDRGPRSADVLQLARNMMLDGTALCVPGNHDMKLLRRLRKGPSTPFYDATLADFQSIAVQDRERVITEIVDFLGSLPSHLVLDHGRLVVAHAGLRKEMIGRDSGPIRAFALYGDTTGEKDEYGLPVRRDWAAEYTGRAAIVYGHSPIAEPIWRHRTINIDTGCAFGGRLTALRYPERELVSVAAQRAYAQPRRPFLHDSPRQADADTLLDDEAAECVIEHVADLESEASALPSDHL